MRHLLIGMFVAVLGLSLFACEPRDRRPDRVEYERRQVEDPTNRVEYERRRMEYPPETRQPDDASIEAEIRTD